MIYTGSIALVYIVSCAHAALDVHFHLGLAYLKTDNPAGAFESLSPYLDAGDPIDLAVRHRHVVGGCDGTLTLMRDSVAYRWERE